MFNSTLLSLTIIISSILSAPALASTKNWSLSHFGVALGAEYLSNLNKRGATLYEGYQVIPIFAIEVFHPDLEIIGSSLNYKYRLNPNILLRTRINLGATGDKPLYETNAPLLFEREGTTEWDNYIEFGWPDRGELTLQYSQDLKAHQGFYLESKLRAVITQFSFKNLNFEPALFASIGGGDEKHNTYLYGSGAGGFGATNYSVGFSIAAPPEIDHFFPAFEAKYCELIGDATRSASLVGSRTSGFQVIALFAIGIL